MNDTAIIICDSHISIFDYKKQNILIDLILEKKDSYKTLVLLGDTFDFYFDYKNFIPKKYFPLFYVLKFLSETKKIYIASGNHDIWLGDFFNNFIKAETKTKCFTLDVSDRKYLLCHGDEFEKKNVFRRFTDIILKSKIAIQFFSFLHPEIGYLLGKIVSNTLLNEKKNKVKTIEMGEKIKLISGYDNYSAILVGHSHESFVSDDSKIFLIGDFKTKKEFAVIDEKGVRIEHI
ncbi:MAG: hypothetical protein COX48_00335 [bacterium (Candidatus Stahlbacteria) CG23_combo_of_CG06-09_8_20_14_all_34_7]|nr:MAG: hypothetical protein COX48_00335 [bacterium (Candidatus Stahlbacteria) CG23_combo_of_CG06-09_8_20_14_all_34_7]